MKSTKSKQGSASVTATKVKVLDESLGRLGFAITNNGSEPVYIGLGEDVNTSIGLYLDAKLPITEKSIGFEWAGEVWAITASGTSTLAVTEFFE